MESILRYSAQGFRQDMQELFYRFANADAESEATGEETEISLRFSRFGDIWRQMLFSHVFKLRHNENDLKEFVDQVYLEVLPYLAREYPLERRVCALYLLYGLYVKQPRVCQKIRMNFAYLEQVRQLIATCKELGQLDVCYIWYKLLALGAVDLVYVSRLMGPHYMHKSRVTYETQTETDFFIDNFKTSLFTPLMEMSHIHERYRTIKDSLVEKYPRLQEDCDSVKDNIFDLSKAKAVNLHKQFFNSLLPSDETTADQLMESDDDSEESEEDIGAKRRKLREKASGFGRTSKRDNETEVVTSEVPPPSPEPVPPTIKKRGRPKLCRLNEPLHESLAKPIATKQNNQL